MDRGEGGKQKETETDRQTDKQTDRERQRERASICTDGQNNIMESRKKRFLSYISKIFIK